MNKNSRKKKPAILAANRGAQRKSTKAKVSAKEPSNEQRGMTLTEQMQFLGNYKNLNN